MATAALTHLEYEISRCIWGLMKKKKQNWHIIDREWLQEALEKHHKMKRQLSTIDKALARLRARGIIKSKTRHITDKDGSFLPRPSLYLMTKKLNNMFTGLARAITKLCGERYLRAILYQVDAETRETRKQENKRLNNPEVPEQIAQKKRTGGKPPERLEGVKTDDFLEGFAAGERPRNPQEEQMVDGIRRANERAKPKAQKREEFDETMKTWLSRVPKDQT